MQQYNCQNGQSWYDVCLNTYGSLDYLGKLVSDNGGELNIQPTTNTVIYWDQSLVKDSSLLSLIKNNGYVYNTGVSIPLPSIQSYTALTSTIDFTNNGGDDWDVTFKITPDNLQLPSGVTIVDYDYIVDFWNSGVQTQLQNADNVNIDTTVNVGSNGAGVYSLQQHYNLSNGTNLYIWDLIKVDASGNVLDYVKLNGAVVNSVNGLTVNVTANMTQSQSYPVEWGASPSFAIIGSGVSASLSVPIGSDYVGYIVVLGAEFSDFNLNFSIYSSSVVIS